MEQKRNVGLDFLKLFACFAVVGLHIFTYNYQNIFITYIHYMCGFAVPVFFTVNGYLILNKPVLDYRYVFRKIMHILFIVILWNMLIFSAFLILKGTLMNPLVLIAKSLVERGQLWQFWFLGAMILTYLTAPLLHYIINRFRYGFFILTLVSFTACFGVWLLNVITRSSPLAPVFQTFKLWIWLFYFIIGGYLKKWTEVLSEKLTFRLHFTLTVILFTLFPLYQLYADDNINFHAYYNDPVAIMNNICLFTFALRIPFNEKQSRTIISLSSAGMGCYIIHPLLIKCIGMFVHSYSPVIPFILYPAVVFISFLITYIMKKFTLTKYFVDL